MEFLEAEATPIQRVQIQFRSTKSIGNEKRPAWNRTFCQQEQEEKTQNQAIQSRDSRYQKKSKPTTKIQQTMKTLIKIITLLLFIGLVWGQNPCEDPKYIALKEKGVDNMNDEEFDYFINILPNCKSDKEKVIEKKKKLHEIKRYHEWKEKWPSTKESFTLPDGTFDMKSYNRWLAKQHGIKLN